MKIDLPTHLSFIKDYYKSDSKYLVKLGGFIDGSYIVDYRSVLSAKYLISGGVGSNVRFESDFRLINKNLLIVFVDPTTSLLRMFTRAIYHFFKSDQSGYYSLGEVFNYLGLRKFATHIYKYLGKFYNITSLCTELAIKDRFFLKLDIEGAEYELLNSIVENKGRIYGICIEFHDLNNKDNILLMKDFVRKLDFNILSVSINELSMNEFAEPNIIEVSFSPKIDMKWPGSLDESYYLQSCNTQKGETIVFNYKSIIN